MSRQLRLVLSVALLASASTAAQVPVAELAKPPADARHFIIQSTGGKHGDSWSWIAPDGTRMGRESLNLRGQVWELDFSRQGRAPTACPRAWSIRGVTPHGRCGRDLQRSAAATAQLEEPDRRGQRGLFGARVLRLAGRPDRHQRLVPRASAGRARPRRSICCRAAQAHAEKLTDAGGRRGRDATDRSRSGRSPASATRRSPSGPTPTTSSSALAGVVAWLPEATPAS